MLQPVGFIDTVKFPNVELAGADRRWHPADARIEGETIVARSDNVPAPLHIRYAYTNIPAEPLLYNSHGLPAAMFTTLED